MTTPVVRLADELRRQIVDHCLGALPGEGCGLLAMSDNRIAKVYPTDNEGTSRDAFKIPPQSHLDALVDAEGRAWRLGGVFHSHPRGSSEMSDIDVAAALDPEWVYLVVGLDGTEPEVRAWEVRESQVVELVIE